MPIDGELDEDGAEYKALLKERTIAIEDKMQAEADARDPDYITPDTSEDEADKWDAETILSTYSNLDNHPGIIRYKPKVKTDQKLKISLDKQFKVPIDGLNGLIPIAEEIEVKKEKKKRNYKNAYVEEDTDSDEEEEEETTESKAKTEGAEGSDGSIKELNPKKAHKKLVKAERKEKRKQKKELKVAFKTAGLKMVKQSTVVDAGNIRPGVSVKKI